MFAAMWCGSNIFLVFSFFSVTPGPLLIDFAGKSTSSILIEVERLLKFKVFYSFGILNCYFG